MAYASSIGAVVVSYSPYSAWYATSPLHTSLSTLFYSSFPTVPLNSLPYLPRPFALEPLEDPLARLLAARLEVAPAQVRASSLVHCTASMLLSHGIAHYSLLPLRLSRAQLLLRWALQRGAAAIPRSSSPDHLQSNLAAAHLPPLGPLVMRLLDLLQFLVSSPYSKFVPIYGPSDAAADSA